MEEIERRAARGSWLKGEEESLMGLEKARKVRRVGKRERKRHERAVKAEEVRMMGLEEVKSKSIEKGEKRLCRMNLLVLLIEPIMF
jgi:hypothetical protein